VQRIVRTAEAADIPTAQSHRLRRWAFIAIACGTWSSPSHAYLDPGTGSIILQSILASIAVALGVLRFYWQRFRAFFSSLTTSSGKAGDSEQEREPDSDPQ
jgi:hypothetical protein